MFDRTVNQGAGGCPNLIDSFFTKNQDMTVEEEIKLLESIRDNWSETHFIYKRVNSILTTTDFINQQYII